MAAASGTETHPSAPRAVPRDTERVARLLTWVAGAVDAIGYLSLAHLFTAHMSGNSVAAGAAVGQAEWGTVLERGAPIAFFVLGVWAGATITEVRRDQGAQHPFATLYAVEIVLLGLFWLAGVGWMGDGSLEPAAGWQFYAAAALPTLAMGMQGATVRRVGPHGVRTTYMSGVLTNLAEALAQVMARRGDGEGDQKPGESPRERLGLYTGLWVAYLAGAIMGGFSHLHWALAALALPVAGLVLAAVWDLRAPRELGAKG